MDELLIKASRFLQEHPEINEVELTNAYGEKVHLVRSAPVPIAYWNWNGYNWQYKYH